MSDSAAQTIVSDDACPPQLIAYARISDLSSKRRTLAGVLGVEAQHAACEAMAHDAGATVTQRYTDNDRSASRGEQRPGFEAMLADLHRGRTDDGEPVHGVVAVDVDRIYKTPAQWERFITAFRASPGRIFVDWQGARDLYAPGADESGLHDVSVVMGENRRRSDRTKRWHAAQARRGIAHTGGRTFGYRPADDAPGGIADQTGRPVVGRWEPIITPSEWEAVRQRYEPRRRAPGGRSMAGKGRTPRKYLLSGFLLCGRDLDGRLCRCVLAGCATKVGQSTYRYACRPKTDGGCGGTAVRGEWMDREITDLVLAVLAGVRPGALKQPAWTRAPELDAITARSDALRAQLQCGDITEASFKDRSAVLDEILRDLHREKKAWEAVETSFSHEAPERLRRWRTRPEEGGYDLRQRRALISGVLASALVFPAGRGRRRQAREGYLPIINRALVIEPPVSGGRG